MARPSKNQARTSRGCLTSLEPGAVVGVPEELESLLEAQGVLRGAVGRLDAADEGGHLPLGLAGGRGQEGLVALVQGARPHRVRHRQHRDLPGEEVPRITFPGGCFTHPDTQHSEEPAEEIPWV